MPLLVDSLGKFSSFSSVIFIVLPFCNVHIFSDYLQGDYTALPLKTIFFMLMALQLMIGPSYLFLEVYARSRIDERKWMNIMSKNLLLFLRHSFFLRYFLFVGLLTIYLGSNVHFTVSNFCIVTSISGIYSYWSFLFPFNVAVVEW